VLYIILRRSIFLLSLSRELHASRPGFLGERLDSYVGYQFGIPVMSPVTPNSGHWQEVAAFDLLPMTDGRYGRIVRQARGATSA